MIRLISNKIANAKRIMKPSQSYAKKLSINSVQKDSFEKRNTDMNNEIYLKYQKKILVLPLVMDRIMYSIGNYYKNRQDNDLSKQLLEGYSTLLKRINFSDDGEKYAKNYAPELKLIEETTAAYEMMRKNTISKEEFDTALNKRILTYIQDDFERESFFVK